MNKAPCKDCNRRSAICHAQCVAYHEWVAERQKALDKKRRDKLADEFIYQNIDKWRKWSK